MEHLSKEAMASFVSGLLVCLYIKLIGSETFYLVSRHIVPTQVVAY